MDVTEEVKLASPEVKPTNPLEGVSEDQMKLIIALHEQAKVKAADIKPEDEDVASVTRELYIAMDKRYGLLVVKREGGGRVPMILSGAYDDRSLCERNIEAYSKGLLKPMPVTMTNTAVKADQKQTLVA